MTTLCAPSACSPPRSPTPWSKAASLPPSRISRAEKVGEDDEPPVEDIPEYTQYSIRKYAEQLMSESISDEDLPSMSLPAQGTRRRLQLATKRSRPVNGAGVTRCGSQPAGAGATVSLYQLQRGESMEISAKLVKQLRDRTGAGMMECKKALDGSQGRPGGSRSRPAQDGHRLRRQEGRRVRTKQGVIGSYIHPGAQFGVLVEVNCESDFVARTDDFQELVKDLAMQVAAADPQFIRSEDVTADALEKEKDIERARALAKASPKRSSTRSSKAAWTSSTKRSACASSRSSRKTPPRSPI